SHIRFENFMPANIDSIFPKGKKGTQKSYPSKRITLEIKGNNNAREFQGKVRYTVRRKRVNFPYDRDFPKINLSSTQINEIFGSSYSIKCFISTAKEKKNKSDNPKMQSPKKIGDLELAELAQKKIEEKKFKEAQIYIKRIKDKTIRSLFLKFLENKKSN
ncbi:MAG: hypothetical protein VX794_03705, partial [Nitrospinota bacterium]|nr:hypothetical protein [Nitrospinota bacterium]